MPSVGSRLKDERERLGMSQIAFRKACGVGKTAQHYFETDQQLPGGAYLIAADNLGVDILYVLLGRRGNPRQQAPTSAHAVRGSVAVAGGNNRVTVASPLRRKK